MTPSNKDKVLEVIRNTFRKAYETGFEEDRVEAILHKTELGLKYQSHNFGLNLVMALALQWNHTDDSPLKRVEVNKNVERFRADMKKNPSFLQEKIRQYFIDNNHQLVLFMTPDETFTDDCQQKLDKIRDDLVKNLDEEAKKTLFESGKQLLLAQSAKVNVDCLPSLKMTDILDNIPRYSTRHMSLSSVPVQLSVQPTNEVALQ